MCIIVASDNLFRRELSSYLLAEAHYEVREACTSSDLLETLGLEEAHLLLIDHALAEAQNDLAHRVRALTNAPILWLANRAHVSQTSTTSANEDTICWPYSPPELVKRVEELLSRFGQDDQERVVG